MKKQRRITKIIAFSIAAILIGAMVGCGGDSGKSASGTSIRTAAGSDTLIIAFPVDPMTLDPNDNNFQMSHALKRNIYEPLVTIDNDNKIQPCLAESWEYTDDTTLILHLRKGVQFHNGEELKASDVVFTLNRVKDMPSAKLAVEKMDFDKTEAVDDYTVKVVTKVPFPAQIRYFEWPLTCIINQKAFEESGGDFTKAPIGTGAYKLKEWVSGDRIELEAFDEYWQEGKPELKNVILRMITEPANRSIELESGGVDIAYEIPASDIPRLDADPNINVVRSLSLNTNYLAMNCEKTPLNDVKVRKAIAYALDTPSAVQTAYKGTGIPAQGFFTPSIEGFNPNVKLISHDVDKAKELLTEAGYPNGFDITLTTDTTRERADIAEIFQNQLAQAGIRVTIQQMEQGAMVAAYERSEHELLIVGFTGTTGEASRALGFFQKDNPVQSVWRWYNDDFSNLVDEASVTMDEQKRTELYQKAQDIMVEEYPVVPILHREILNAERSYVQDFENNRTFESHTLKDVHFASPEQQ